MDHSLLAQSFLSLNIEVSVAPFLGKGERQYLHKCELVECLLMGEGVKIDPLPTCFESEKLHLFFDSGGVYDLKTQFVPWVKGTTMATVLWCF